MTDTIESYLREHISTYETDVNYYSYTLPQKALHFGCADELIREAQRHGHYFSEGATRTFKTKTYELYGGRFLVISNRYGYDGAERFYKVLWLYENPATCNNRDHVKNSVSDLSTSFDTLNQARKAAQRLAELIDAGV